MSGFDDLMAVLAPPFGRAAPAGSQLSARAVVATGGQERLDSGRGRRREAGVADDVRFATKPALRMLARAVEAGLPAKWVTADEAYGNDAKFRLWLQERRVGYVLAVPSNQRAFSNFIGAGLRRVGAR